jgi:hypothetical protein
MMLVLSPQPSLSAAEIQKKAPLHLDANDVVIETTRTMGAQSVLVIVNEIAILKSEIETELLDDMQRTK